MFIQFLRRHKTRRFFGRLRSTFDDNIKMNFIEVRWEGLK
jgi:hypothetical protein